MRDWIWRLGIDLKMYLEDTTRRSDDKEGQKDRNLSKAGNADLSLIGRVRCRVSSEFT